MKPEVEKHIAEAALHLEELRYHIHRLTRKAMILVVEDLRLDTELLLEELHAVTTANVVCVASGEAAVTELVTRDYDVILLDLSLPGMSGRDVIQQMSECERKKLVIVTGLNQEAQEVMEAIRMGAVKVITKPVKAEDLKAIFIRAI